MKKNKSKYLLCFITPGIILFTISIMLGCWPLSNSSIQIGDMWAQHYVFVKFFWDNLIHGRSLSFTSQLGGGISTEFLYIYYAMQPLGFLTFLDGFISEIGVAYLMTFIYIGIASLTMCLYCNKKIDNINLSTLAGVAYALCGWEVACNQHIIWLWAFAIFPVLKLIFDKFIYEEKKMKYGVIYSLVLSSIIISNFFIGFIICIFLVIDFIFKVLCDKALFKKRFIWFAIFSLLSGLICTPIIYIVFDNILSNPSVSQDLIHPSLYEQISTAFKGILPFNNESIKNTYYNFSYTCNLFIISATLFAFDKDTKLKEKVLKFGPIFIIFISMTFYDIEKIWYAGDPPDGVYRRMAFIWSFLIIECGCMYLNKYKKISIKEIIRVGAVLFAPLIFMFLCGNKWGTLFNVLFIVAYLYLLEKKDFGKCKTAAILELALSSFLMVCVLGYYTLNDVDIKIEEENNARYISLYDFIIDNKVNENDNIGNFSTYFSGLNLNVCELLFSLNKNAGNTSYCLDVAYYPLETSLFGIDYIYTKNEEDLFKFELISEYNGNYIYKNKLSTSIGYIVPGDIDEYKGSNNTVYDNQNELTYLMYGENIFKDTDIIGNISSNSINFIVDSDYEILMLTYNAESNDDAYYYDVIITINNELYSKKLGSLKKRKTIYLEDLKKGDIISIDFDYDGMLDLKLLGIKEFDKDSFMRWHDNLTKEMLENVEYGDNEYRATINCSKDDSFLLITIPYNKNLSAYIDGENIEITPTLKGALCGLKIDKGKHKVILRYENKILKYTFIVSIISLLILLILYLKYRKAESP